MQDRSPEEWDRLIDAIDPPSLLLVIEGRMSAALRSRFTPEDIWQEALLHAWRDRERCEWRGLKAFRSWLLTIIDNRIREAADHFAAIKRGGDRPAEPFSSLAARNGNNGSADGSWSGIVQQSTTPSRIAMLREQAEAIRAALASLPDDVRDVVRLRLIEQLSIGEIADQLGIGASAVRHRFRRGAEQFAARLRESLASRTGAVAARMGEAPAAPARAATIPRPESSPGE